MTTLPAASGIVLAGGRSSRFGRDKLAEPVGDGPLLRFAIEAVRRVTTEVIVVAAPGGRPALPSGVRLVHDEAAFEGPLAGCYGGLLAAREPLVIVVGGDMPTLQPAVLAALIRGLAASSADVAVLDHVGRRQPLPTVLRTGTGTEVVRRLLADRERRLGALFERLLVHVLPETEWRALDPASESLRDIDEPADLARWRQPE